jgi:hypothetical protein
MEHTPRSVLPFEFRVLWVVIALWFLLGVEVVKVTEELVESVHRRQVLIFEESYATNAIQ